MASKPADIHQSNGDCRRAWSAGSREILPVPIPLDCSDGFNEAYYGRPEMLLDPRGAACLFGLEFGETTLSGVLNKRLGHDLSSGRWDQRYGYYRQWPTFAGSLKLIVNRI